MNRLIVGYLRVSTDMQTIENQRTAIQQYAVQHNLIIDKWCVDEGISAYSVDANKRPGLNEVRELAHEGKVGTLLVFESSRISRRHLVGQVIISELSNNGVTIISITEGTLNSNEIDSLLNSIRMYSNETSSRLTSQRVKSAKTVMAKQGQYLGGKVLLGYEVRDGKLRVVEEYRGMIVQVFKTYLNKSAKAAIEYLKEHNITKTNQTLRFMLTNKTYIGRYYKTEDNKEIYTPELRIVDDDLFYKVQQAYKDRCPSKEARILTDRTNYLCEGLLFHSCGRKMVLSTSNKWIVYRSRCDCINQKSFIQYKLDNIVSEMVGDWFYRLDTNELKEQWAKRQSLELQDFIQQEKRLNDLLNNKNAVLNKANKKLQQAIIGDYPLDMIQTITDSIKDLKSNISNVAKDIDELQHRILALKQLESKNKELSDELLNFKYLYSKATQQEKKLLIRAIVDKIVVTNWYDIQIKFKY